MQKHTGLLGIVALLAWTACADAQPFVSAFGSKSNSPQSGLSAFFGQTMSNRPPIGTMMSNKPSMPSAFSLTSIFPSFSNSIQNTLMLRAPSSAPSTFQLIGPAATPPPVQKK